MEHFLEPKSRFIDERCAFRLLFSRGLGALEGSGGSGPFEGSKPVALEAWAGGGGEAKIALV